MIAVDPILAARRIQQKYKLSIPVRPEYLAFKVGIPVLAANLSDNLSGVLVPERCGNETRYVIVVNSKHRLTRQRFSVAHELGHYFLHRGMQFAFTNHRRRRGRLEREADLFAAELLMPEEAVRCAASLMDFDGLVQIFGVSAAAMRRRLQELQITPKVAIA